MNLPFSTIFPNGKHDLTGKPTNFVKKICLGLMQNNLITPAHCSELLQIPISKLLKSTEVPKIHTLRSDKKNLWKEGNKIDFWINYRSSEQTRFAPRIPCVSTQYVDIFYFDDLKDEKTAYRCKRTNRSVIVVVDGVNLNIEEMKLLAMNDGFDSLDEFFMWFDKDWQGKLIHWTSKQYNHSLFLTIVKSDFLNTTWLTPEVIEKYKGQADRLKEVSQKRKFNTAFADPNNKHLSQIQVDSNCLNNLKDPLNNELKQKLISGEWIEQVVPKISDDEIKQIEVKSYEEILGLKRVAVIEIFKKDFEQWVIENAENGAMYYQISKLEDLHGKEFDEIELGINYEKVDSYVVECCRKRLIVKKDQQVKFDDYKSEKRKCDCWLENNLCKCLESPFKK